MYDEKRKQSHKGAEDLIVDKIACHKHATLPKLNSPTMPPRNHNQTKSCPNSWSINGPCLTKIKTIL